MVNILIKLLVDPVVNLLVHILLLMVYILAIQWSYCSQSFIEAKATDVFGFIKVHMPNSSCRTDQNHIRA